jgi:S1-C subfamily serine protease
MLPNDSNHSADKKVEGTHLMHLLGRITFAICGMSATTLFGADVNACKYLMIADFANDPFGLAKELRVQGTAHGFQVLSAARDVPTDEGLKVCSMAGSWQIIAGRGYVSMRVLDASGSVIEEASARTGAWTMSANHAVRSVVNKIYSQLGYTGFDEQTFREVIDRRYPKRPTLAVTEEAIKKAEPANSVEGIWTDEEDRYRLGIIRAPEPSGADYFAVVLATHSALWQSGEIKAEIRTTAAPDVFTCTYFMQDKKPIGTTLIMERDSVLRGSPVEVPNNGRFTVTLRRVWPKRDPRTTSAGPEEKLSSFGSGFLLNSDGLMATNWHVVSEAKNVAVSLPSWSSSVSASIVLKDKVNDLAILQISDKAKLGNTCRDLPYELGSSQSIALGQHVSTIGYPLTTMLGSNPKFSEGVVSSKSGIQDDPRWLQISAEIEPGSSGGPLFDQDGNVVGIVVATLDAGVVLQNAGALPQNVNFAIKADYLRSLISMMPGDGIGTRSTPFSPDKAAQCVGLIRAW